MAEIRSKAEFYKLYNEGKLGNRLRNWTPAEWAEFARADKYPVKVIAARCTSVAQAPMCYYLKPWAALWWIRDICNKTRGLDPAAYQLSDLAPDHLNTLQGEVMRDAGGLYMRHVLRSHKRMRECIDGPLCQHVRGLQAGLLLRQYMDAASLDTLSEIFDEYPDSIVEFCCYEKPVGVLHRNTLFWEVRDY